MRLKTTAMLAALGVAGFAWGDTELRAGKWQVKFQSDGQRLELRCGDAVIAGRLAFAGAKCATDARPEAERAAWTVRDSRDGVRDRLALVAPDDNVQGYITFQPADDKVSFLVYHRTALAYHGTLTFDARVTYLDDAFACRLTPKAGDRVLSLKSGDADSAANDALFSAARDEALRVHAARRAIVSVKPGEWELKVTASIAEPETCEVAFEIARDYYRTRWVPNYAPIDRARSPRPPTGWMSWNIYFDKAGSKENLDEARLGQKYLQPFGMEFWSIESWQENSSELPVSKFYNMDLETHPEQFPEGMKWLADEIRKLGFRPGLWTAPFGTGNTNFYKAHTDWFLHDAAGKPISCWNGKFTLDPSVPAAREHLKKIHDIASHDWGYEFFKIDGMSGRGPGYCAHLYERPEIRARFKDPACPNPFELCVKAFREGIGPDRVFLACQGHFTGAEAAYADASRTGADIVHPNQPVKWANILLQARCTVNQNFAHSIVFWSDPDCMMISDHALADEQARVEATVVALPGQQTFAGDKLAELSERRRKMLQQALPVVDARPADLFPKFGHLPVWDLSVKRPWGAWHVVALFNWGDADATVGFDWSEIGEPADKTFVGWEFWTETWQGRLTGRCEMAVPARSVRLVALQPAADTPQFLTSDRHLTQGAVELKGVTRGERAVTATLNVIGGFPMTVRFAVPAGCAVKDVKAPEGVRLGARTEAGGNVLAVTLESDATRDVPVTVEW